MQLVTEENRNELIRCGTLHVMDTNTRVTTMLILGSSLCGIAGIIQLIRMIGLFRFLAFQDPAGYGFEVTIGLILLAASGFGFMLLDLTAQHQAWHKEGGDRRWRSSSGKTA